MKIRPSTSADAEALAQIYGFYCQHGTGTFEETPPDAEEMGRRRLAILAHALPHLVAERDDRVIGFAYAGPFRPRPGYRFTVEDSIYIAPDAAGQGVGRALLSEVLQACEAAGMRQVIATIGDSANTASIGLHRALGFEDAGVGKSLGFKFGRWIDIVWMRKPLNGGDTRAPDVAGLKLGGG